jgi:hypothetical protein
MEPISWVATAVSKVAAFFGWSKPISVGATQVMKPSGCRYMANFNGLDTSMNMGLDAGNTLAPYQFFGDADQLAIDSIVSSLNFAESIFWKTVNASGVELDTFNVRPSIGVVSELVQVDAVTKNEWYRVKSLTFLAYVAQFFRFWRGDIRFQLRCLKTKFHSGRLLISWRPGVSPGTRDLNVPMAYSIVWDVVLNNTISFVVPYMNPKPWLQTNRIEDSIAGSATPDSANGTLVISVLNKLVAASDAVADQVEIMIEVCGEPGFSFGHPVDSHTVPVTFDDPVVGQMDDVDLDLSLEIEGDVVLDISDDEIVISTGICYSFYTLFLVCCGLKSFKTKKKLEGQIGDPALTVDLVPRGMVKQPIEPEKMSMGEKISSFRQLLKRFTLFPLVGNHYDSDLDPALAVMRNSNMYEIAVTTKSRALDIAMLDHQKFSYGPPQITKQGTGGIPAINPKYPQVVDLMTRLGAIFAYWRGGVRLKALTPLNFVSTYFHNEILATYVHARNKSLNQSEITNYVELLTNVGANQISNMDVEGVGEFQFPYYRKYAYNGTSFDPGYEDNCYSVFAVGKVFVGDNVSFGFWRAGADDFDFIFRVGVPTHQYIQTGLPN